MEYDLKWYKALVSFVFGQDLEQVMELYNRKKQSEDESVVNTQKYT